ncbi:DnaJ domain-containing protein, partial [Vibrio parahaemolyticus]
AIKLRYRQLSKLYHPDTRGSEEEMKRLNHAFKLVSQNVTKQ